MFSAIIVLVFLPWLDSAKTRSSKYRPLAKQFFWMFVVVCIGLGYLGAQPPSDIGNYVSQIGTLIYFGFFLLMPWWSQMGTFKPVPDRVTFRRH
jgi:ubiquinol-cytochrome c reductase cytochrome b subunit